jgi:hypothetical protein
MKTIVKFGMATLTLGALLGGTVLSKAETPDTFTPTTCAQMEIDLKSESWRVGYL